MKKSLYLIILLLTISSLMVAEDIAFIMYDMAMGDTQQATLDDAVLYPNPYMVVTSQGYTKHYYAGAERIATVIGGGGLDSMVNSTSVTPTQEELTVKAGFLNHYLHHQDPFLYDGVVDTVIPTEDIRGVYDPNLQYGCPSVILDTIAMKIYPDILLDNITYYGRFRDNEMSSVYFTHSDHLGSTSWITNCTGTPYQYLHYAPYGEMIANQTPYGYDERFKFIDKERDEESGYDYSGERYFYSTFNHWLSVDPLADENPGKSPYAYCSWNPISRIDQDGRADYYDVDGNHLCNDGVADNRVFQQSSKGDVVLGGYATPFSYVGDVDNISLSYDGEMISDSQSEGILTVTQHVGDKEFNQTFSAVSGNRTAYTLQNGEYSCSSFRYRSSSEAHGGYYNNGYGFSINLNPSFKTMRTDLRIHPDGGEQGTLGCIGLTGGASELKQFVRTVTPFVPANPKNTSILLTVVVTGNPGCFKPADKTGPALFR